MKIQMFPGRAAALVPFLVLTLGCTLQKQSAPALTGPSEFGVSIGLTATPDVLPRDGASTSTVRLTARDAQGAPIAGQRLMLSASAGTLSVGEVVTGANGTATFELIAPASGDNIDNVIIGATPVGTNADNAVTRTVAIRVAGPAIPVAGFSLVPAAPTQFGTVTFDASASTLSGTACGATCTYTWSFADGGTATGQVVTHAFQTQGTFPVSLTVASQGASNTTSRHVVVGAPQAITAAMTLSPTNPRVGDTVFLDGRGSTTPDGAAIVDYTWDFGNGSAATGATVSTSYSAARIYTVRLTVRDALGRTATLAQTVTVAIP